MPTPTRRKRPTSSQRRTGRTAARKTSRQGYTRDTTRDDETLSLEAEEVEIHVEDLSSFNPSKNIIVYGPSGHGKTALVGGAPNANFLSTEAGAVAAQRAGHKGRLMRAKSWPYVEAGMKWADENLGPEDWLVVDSATKMQQLLIRWILEVQHSRKKSRDLDIPAIPDHQKWQNMFLRFISRIIDSKYNSILVATSMIKTDEEGEDIVMPNIVGKDYTIAQNFCAEADMVLYYAVSKTASTRRETIRRILAQPYPPYTAKDRYDVLGKYMDVHEGEYDAMAEVIERIEFSGASEDEEYEDE